jgi:hypothetical protein
VTQAASYPFLLAHRISRNIVCQQLVENGQKCWVLHLDTVSLPTRECILTNDAGTQFIDAQFNVIPTPPEDILGPA